MADIFNMDILTSLQERLAQAERMAAANLRNYKELLEAAERERDEWREKANTTAAWGQAHGLNVTELTAERDAALAKAEAAEKTGYSEGYRDAMDSLGEPARALADLRARIEALADNWGDAGWAHARALRALLQAAKPETALDVLSRIEDIVARSGMGENSYTEPLAKLRKILEEQK